MRLVRRQVARRSSGKRRAKRSRWVKKRSVGIAWFAANGPVVGKHRAPVGGKRIGAEVHRLGMHEREHQSAGR